MRRAAAVALLVLLASASLPTAGGEVDAPRWSPGDFWSYAVEIAIEEGLVLNGSLRAEVEGLGVPPVKGATATAYKTVLTGGGEVRNAGGGPQFRGQWTFAAEEWVEATGFKILKSVSTIDANGTVAPFNLLFSFQVQNTTENDVLSDSWRYPLEVGTSGSYVTNTTSTESVRFRYGGIVDEATRTATYIRTLGLSVTGSSVLRVAAGAYDTLVIRVAWPNGEVDRWWYAPAIGNNARTETYNATQSKVAESSLRDFRYQAGEPEPSILGLPSIVWIGLLSGAAAASSAFIVLRIRRRRSRIPAAKDLTPRVPGQPPGAV